MPIGAVDYIGRVVFCKRIALPGLLLLGTFVLHGGKCLTRDFGLGIGFSLVSEEYGIGFRKGSDVTAKLNEFLAKLKASGELQALATKYKLTLAE